MASIIKNERVRRGPDSDGPPARASSSEDPCAKSVRLVRLEGLVRALEVACSCGEITTIELEYSEGEVRS